MQRVEIRKCSSKAPFLKVSFASLVLISIETLSFAVHQNNRKLAHLLLKRCMSQLLKSWSNISMFSFGGRLRFVFDLQKVVFSVHPFLLVNLIDF